MKNVQTVKLQWRVCKSSYCGCEGVSFMKDCGDILFETFCEKVLSIQRAAFLKDSCLKGCVIFSENRNLEISNLHRDSESHEWGRSEIHFPVDQSGIPIDAVIGKRIYGESMDCILFFFIVLLKKTYENRITYLFLSLGQLFLCYIYTSRFHASFSDVFFYSRIYHILILK